MSESNGKVTTIPGQLNEEPEKYRPKASTETVHNTVIRSLAAIVSRASSEAGNFVYLAEIGDEEGTAVRYGHLVDASECLEIALTHLGQLKAEISYRLRVEDEHNVGIGYQPI